MTRRTLNPDSHLKYREVEAHFDHHPAVTAIRQSGSHKTWVGPRGSVTAPVGHNGDVPRGTLRSICRMAALAGLLCLVLFCVAPFVL